MRVEITVRYIVGHCSFFSLVARSSNACREFGISWRGQELLVRGAVAGYYQRGNPDRDEAWCCLADGERCLVRREEDPGWYSLQRRLRRVAKYDPSMAATIQQFMDVLERDAKEYAQ